MKNILYILLTVVMMTCLTACASASTISLTAEEQEAVSQYAAYLILKYDANNNFQEKLLDPNDLVDARNAMATPTPIVIADSSVLRPVDQPAVPTPTETPDANADESSDATLTPVPTEVISPTMTEEPVVNQLTLAECIGLDGITVDFNGITESNSYKADNEYFSITSPEGQEIIVTDFTFTNISENPIALDMSTVDVDFQLVTNGSKSTKPRISLLSNDLQFLNLTLEPGESINSVLLFFVASEPDTIKLNVLSDYVDGNAQKHYNINIK